MAIVLHFQVMLHVHTFTLDLLSMPHPTHKKRRTGGCNQYWQAGFYLSQPYNTIDEGRAFFQLCAGWHQPARTARP